MSDFLVDGMTWLEEKRHEVLTTEVTYSRVNYSVTIVATIGRTRFKTLDEYGRWVKFESRDFLLLAEELILNGSVVLPEVGDIITERGVNYEVLAMPTAPHWRYSDVNRNTLRIHTKETV